LADGTPSPKIFGEMEIRLHPNVLADVSDESICRSTELVLRKRVAVQEKTISVLINDLDSLEQ